MSDELKSQSSQAPVSDQQQQSPPQQHQQHHQSHPYHYHGGNNNYSQRGGRGGHHNNNRQGQQRGGRYGSNKYNSGQYGRYNNGVGNGNRNYNGGYKSHRSPMNPATATAMNIQWPGYYNSPPIYYVPPQLVPTADAAAASGGSTQGPSTDASSSNSPNSSVSGASTPQPKKIEITTKTGQHLDLNAIHNQHSTPNADGDVEAVSAGNDNANETSDHKEPNTSESTPQPTEKEAENVSQEKGESKEDAEKTKREFLEQIKLRKQAMEKKKQEDALKKQGGEDKTTPAQASAPEVPSEQKQAEEPSKNTATDASSSDAAAPTGNEKSGEVAANSGEQEQQEVPAQQPKSGTYAAKLAVIKQQKAQEAAKAESEKKDQEPEQKSEESQEKQDQQTSEPKEQESKQPSVNPAADVTKEASAEKPAGEDVSSAPAETAPAGEASSSPADTTAPGTAESEKSEVDDSTVGTMSQLLEKLENAAPIEDVYSFEYPESVERPDPKYKSSYRKYTYGPTFLLQFKDRVKAKPDEEWVQKSISKIVITPSMMKVGKPRDAGFGGPGGRGGDFRKSGSLRNMEGRSSSRSSSKKKSKRMMDDRKSNRPYTSRRDRERTEREAEEQKKEDEKPKEDVKPLIPSANRWIPKSKLKKAAEKKLAPDGVTELLEKEDAERKMKSLLNKLTLEMFDQISSQILQIADQSKWEKQGETLKVVIEQIFHKACDEPHWSSMYAQLCGKVVKELNPEIADETNEGKTGPKLVLHYLVARCHEEFDKGWTDKLPTKEDGSPLEPEMMSDEYYTLAAAKRRGLGLVRFIGYLYRLNLLTGKMMFECFRRLMKDLSNAPSEETLESVVELLNTVGEQFETDSFSAGQATLEGSALLDSLFATLQNIIEESKVSSRMKFKLIDIRELREEKNWNSAKKQDGPKTIQQIHEEEKERQMKQSSSRSGSRRMNSSMGGRSSSRREPPSVSKDSFVSTRSSSLRHPQKSSQKEETRKPEKSATNMFSALMDSNEDEE